jgi:hypothetical protein
MPTRPGLPLALASLALVSCGGGSGSSAPQLEVSYGAPVELWRNGGCFASWCQTGWYASPALVDLRGDGALAVVWGSYDLVALEAATGALRWRASNGSRVWPSPAVADLDGDGALEIAVGRGGDQLTVYSAAGAARWSAHPFGAGEVRTLAVAPGLTGDDRLAVVVGRASEGETRQLSVYSPAGTVLPGWPARHDLDPGYGWGMYNENVAVADLDGDGDAEVVGPTDTHYITALDHAGAQLPVNARYGGGKVWSQVGVHVSDAVDLRGYANCGTEHRPNFANSAPVVADLDGDGTREIVVVGNVYDCGADPYRSLYHMPFILKADRSRWSGAGHDWTEIPAPRGGSGPRSEDWAVIETALPNPAVADLDGDGQKEILYASYDGRLHALWLDKTEHGRWPFTVPGPGYAFASEPAVADLDGDGSAEVIFTSWPPKASGRTGTLFILDAQGRQAHAVALPPARSGDGWNGGLGAPTLARLEPGGDLHVFVGTAASGVVAYRIPNTAGAEILWGTGRGSLLRRGVPGEGGAARFRTRGSAPSAAGQAAAPAPPR